MKVVSKPPFVLVSGDDCTDRDRGALTAAVAVDPAVCAGQVTAAIPLRPICGAPDQSLPYLAQGQETVSEYARHASRFSPVMALWICFE